MSLKKILVVEDDIELAELTKEYLEAFDYEVLIESKGMEAVSRVKNEKPDLVILDIMLPDKDGIEICKELRDFFNHPILMLSARTDNIDQIVGLEIGADEYLCKPVEPRLLAAKVKAHLRREDRKISLSLGKNKLLFSGLEISSLSRTVSFENKIAILSTIEFDLCWFLAKHQGEVKSRDDIFNNIKGVEYNGQSRAVDIHISQIRSKLTKITGRGSWIKTIRGHGYIFNDEGLHP